MREIKFRAWDKDLKRTVYTNDNWTIDSEYSDLSWYIIDTIKCQDEGKKDKYTLMQYTGLKDKNGVEIYEGDIVTNTFTNSLGTKKTRDIVEYKKYFWGYFPLYAPRDGKFEVIGNIYENPELLREDNG